MYVCLCSVVLSPSTWVLHWCPSSPLRCLKSDKPNIWMDEVWHGYFQISVSNLLLLFKKKKVSNRLSFAITSFNFLQIVLAPFFSFYFQSNSFPPVHKSSHIKVSFDCTEMMKKINYMYVQLSNKLYNSQLQLFYWNMFSCKISRAKRKLFLFSCRIFCQWNTHKNKWYFSLLHLISLFLRREMLWVRRLRVQMMHVCWAGKEK